jgi:glucokinase
VSTTVGIDIGGTKLLAVVLDADGVIVREQLAPSPIEFDAVVAAIAQEINALVDTTGAGAAGLGIAGMVDRNGVVAYAPNMPGLRRAPVRAAVEERITVPLAVDNDANVAALGEARYGSAAGRRDVLLVTLGTGIGGGLVLDGDLYRGAHGYAGEIGHFMVDIDGPLCACGARGHWEAIASGSALDRMTREVVASGGGHAILDAAGGDPSAVTGEHAGLAARAGDAAALDVIARLGDGVALGLAGLCNILDPEAVVISGGLIELGDLLMGPVRERFAHHLEATAFRPAIEVEAARLGARAGAVGAAVMARELL